MNPERGDVTVELNGVEHVLRPTFDALVEIETKLGIGITALARRFIAGDYGARDIAVVVAAGIRGAGGKPPPDIGALAVAAGLATLAGPLTVFLVKAVTGDGGPGGNVQAPQG